MAEIHQGVVDNLTINGLGIGLGLLDKNLRAVQREKRLEFRSCLLSTEQKAAIAKRLSKAVLANPIFTPWAPPQNNRFSIKLTRT